MRILLKLRYCFILLFTLLTAGSHAQVIISQYYEGKGINKWIELTNLGSSSIVSNAPQLKLGLWSRKSTDGKIDFSGKPDQVVDLLIIIRPRQSVLIGNPQNEKEVPYLGSRSGIQYSADVINFDGNDGIALLDASGNIIDKFGEGINAADISYSRNKNVLEPSATFKLAEWTAHKLTEVQHASENDPARLGRMLPLQACTCCNTPAFQPVSLVFGTITSNSISGSFNITNAPADEYLVVRSTSSTLSSNPVDLTVYNVGDVLGGGVVAAKGPGNTFTASGLNSSSTYYFFIFSVKSTSCSPGPKYLTLNPLTGNTTTTGTGCVTPSSQPTSLVFGTVTSASIAGSFNASGANEYLVVRNTASSLSSNPADGTVYNSGDALGGGIVVSRGATTSFTSSGLNSNTTYYFFVFALNNSACTGGPKYLTVNPLTGNQATSLPACAAPSSQPTSLVFGTVTSASIAGSFAASGANEYLVVRNTVSSLSSNPADGAVYNSGDALGGGAVVSRGSTTSFTSSGLNSNTTYYFFVFALNNSGCTGGPKYLTANPLTGNQATLLPTCIAPSSQPTALVFGTVTSVSIAGSFTASGANEYLVVRNTVSSLSANPADGTVYNSGDALGGGTVVSRGSSTSFTSSGLSSNTLYYFFVFALNNTACLSGPKYLTVNPLTGNSTTLLAACTTPVNQPTAIIFNTVTYNSIQGSFTAAAGVTDYLVVMSSNSSLTATPADGTSYTSGVSLGGGTVINSGTSTSFTAAGLNSNNTYYFFVFSFSNSVCTGGPKYFTTNPLTGNQATGSPLVSVLNFYFGNLHSHSSYSDGNADNTNKIPADDYAFAKNSMCMDFLGICEHNHSEAGMHLVDWQPGIVQANAATSSDFIALHGMEWGVISQGGHVVVYGIDSLIGWETNNYQIFVAEGNYRGVGGLFSIINRHGNGAFGYYAHPNTTDFDSVNVSGTAYDASTDSAIIGSAVESGPAFSTDSTYTDPGTPMSYLTYYRSLLSKGYKVGPTMDHDNHNLTFGRTATTRLVILATSLSKTNLLTSMRQRRFYASEDCAAKITYSISSKPMGSIITQSGAPVITVTTLTSATISSIKVMFGVPGSGSNANQLTSTTSSSLTFTDNALAVSATRYYYLDITETDGKRIITAPIWYTRQ